MKLQIAEILPLLRVVTPFTNKNKTGLLPIYSSVKLAGNEVTGFNGECGIIRKTQIDWSELNCALVVGPLIALLEKIELSYPEVELTLEQVNGEVQPHNVVRVKAGKFSATLYAFPVTDFPNPGIDKPVTQSYDLYPDFLKHVREARFSAATDLAAPILSSVAVVDGKIYGAESRRIFRLENSIDTKGIPIILMRELVDSLVQIGEAPTKLEVMEGFFVFSTTTSKIFGKRFADDGKYPNINGAIEKTTTGEPLAEATFDNTNLGRIIDRLMVVNNQSSSTVRVSTTADGLLIENAGTEKNAQEELPCKIKGTGDIVVNGKLLLDAVQRFTAVKFYDRALVFENADSMHLVCRMQA